MMSKTIIGIVTAISFLSLLALQTELVNATQTGEQMQSGISNVTQESKSAGNQTGEQAQSGISNVTQESKSAAKQTGEEGQSFMNQTGEALQQINPFK
jgi:hypothetical protein